MSQAQLETTNPKLETDLREIAQDIVRRAMSGGATSAECVVREGDEFSTLVRLGQVEVDLVRLSGKRGGPGTGAVDSETRHAGNSMHSLG